MKLKNKSLITGVCIGIISMFIMSGCAESNQSSAIEYAKEASKTGKQLKFEVLDNTTTLITDKGTGVQYLVIEGSNGNGGVAIQPLINRSNNPISEAERL